MKETLTRYEIKKKKIIRLPYRRQIICANDQGVLMQYPSIVSKRQQLHIFIINNNHNDCILEICTGYFKDNFEHFHLLNEYETLKRAQLKVYIRTFSFTTYERKTSFAFNEPVIKVKLFPLTNYLSAMNQRNEKFTIRNGKTRGDATNDLVF